jgi:hypothetical protein
MSPLDAAGLCLVLYLPFHWLVRRHFLQLEDPAYLRRQGVVIQSDTVLAARSAPIGEYLGRPISGSLEFMGMRYRFDRVLDRRHRERIAPGELFVEPGLVYVLVVR